MVILCYSLGVFAAYHYYTKRNERAVAYHEDLVDVKEELKGQIAELSHQVELLHADVHALSRKVLLMGMGAASIPVTQ